MPNWAMHFMMRMTAPSMIRNLESRYIAQIKKYNLTRDLTFHSKHHQEITSDREDNKSSRK